MQSTLLNTATVTKVEKDPYVIHTYASPESAELVNSHIIETPSSLVIVDAQLLSEQARAVRDYANSLGKPIRKVLVSHNHPDHWAGLEAFADVPLYALPETVYELQNYGQMMLDSKKPMFGDAVTSTVTVPQPLTVDSEIVDGLTLNYQKNFGTESTFSLMVELPELNALIAQDLVYNGVYPYVGDRNYMTNQFSFDTWIAQLKAVKEKGYELVFPGHGRPTDAQSCDTMIDVLTYMKSVVDTAADGADFKRKVMEKYPAYKVVEMLDLSVYMLYSPPYGQ